MVLRFLCARQRGRQHSLLSPLDYTIVKTCAQLFSFRQLHIRLIGAERLIRRADDLAVGGKLFHAVRAPADHTRDGEDRGVELHRQSKHLVYKAGIDGKDDKKSGM